jgi:hypothetical protein
MSEEKKYGQETVWLRIIFLRIYLNNRNDIIYNENLFCYR